MLKWSKWINNIRSVPGGEVMKTANEENQHWLNVTDLDDGSFYEFVVVAVNGGGLESRSEPTKLHIGTGTWILQSSYQ